MGEGVWLLLRAMSRRNSSRNNLNYFGIFVPVSNLEKNLIDRAYYKIGAGNDEVLRLLAKADRIKLKKYIKKSGVRSKILNEFLARV